VKQTLLSKSAVYPSNIERQKTLLALQIFNDKVVALLLCSGKIETGQFISLIIKMWKILNVKYNFGAIRYNDPDRSTINKFDHDSIQHLLRMANIFENMPITKGKSRTSLTCETRQAIIHTLRCKI